MQKNNIGQKPKKHFIHHNNQVIVEDIMTTGNRATDHLDFGGKKYKPILERTCFWYRKNTVQY